MRRALPDSSRIRPDGIARCHLGGAAHKYTHLTGTDFGEQLLFTHLGIGFVDIADLLCRNATLHEFCRISS